MTHRIQVICRYREGIEGIEVETTEHESKAVARAYCIEESKWENTISATCPEISLFMVGDFT